MSFKKAISIEDNAILSGNQVGYGNVSSSTKDISFIKNDTTFNYGANNAMPNATVTGNSIGSQNQIGGVNLKAKFGDVSLFRKNKNYTLNKNTYTHNYNTNNQYTYNINNQYIVNVSESIQKSRQLLQIARNKNPQNNSVGHMFAVLSQITTVASLFVPQASVFVPGLALLGELMDFCRGTDDEKQSYDGNFISLMHLALGGNNLKHAKGLLKSLTAEIKQVSISMIKEMYKRGKGAKGRDIWLQGCQEIYDAYKPVTAAIHGDLTACSETLNFQETNIEAAAKTVNQIISLVGVIYFRYIIYTTIAFIFGDGTNDSDKDCYKFTTKTKIMGALNESTKDLILPLKVLSKPKPENRIILTLFYSSIDSCEVIKCLQFFDKSFEFTNPEHDLCPNWDQRNNSQSPYFRLFCKKWPEKCIGINRDKHGQKIGWVACSPIKTPSYQGDTIFHVGHLALKRTATATREDEAFGKYELLITVKATASNDASSIKYESTRNAFQVEQALQNALPEYKLYESLISKVSTYSHEFIIFKIFTDEDTFYYISLKEKPDCYVYLDYWGYLKLYNSIKSPPTLEGQWKCLDQMNNTRYINKITIVNDLDKTIKHIQLYFANGDEHDDYDDNHESMYTHCKYDVDIHKKTGIIKDSFVVRELGNVSSGCTLNVECGLKSLHTACYWDVQFTTGGVKYKLNQNNAAFYFHKKDAEKGLTIKVCSNWKGIWCDFVSKSKKQYYWCKAV